MQRFKFFGAYSMYVRCAPMDVRVQVRSSPGASGCVQSMLPAVTILVHAGPASPALPSPEPAPSDALPESEVMVVTVVTPVPLLLPDPELPEPLEVPELEWVPELELVAPDPDPVDVIPMPEEPELPVEPELEPIAPFMTCPASGRESGEPDEPQPLNEPRRAVANTTELRMVLPPVIVMIPGETERVEGLAYFWESGCFS